MKPLNQLFQSDDWKNEKHVPVINAPESVQKNEAVDIRATIGKEIHHPNTVPHHIRWVSLFFLPEGSDIPIELASAQFTAHGDGAPEEEEAGVYSEPSVAVRVKFDRPGTLLAASYCNIHGLWESSRPLNVE